MKIIAIGGGHIGGSDKPSETTPIDKELVRLSAKKHPSFLFIPTASDDHAGYIDMAYKYFGEELGCKVNTLIIDKNITQKEIEAKILESDIVYVGGGNTLKMMNKWRRFGVHKALKKAAQQGTVLSGLSAGAICWFAYGASDSRKFLNPEAGLIKVSGLNLIPLTVCPHFKTEKDRQPYFKMLMKKTRGVGLAIDDWAALEIVDNNYRVIKSKDSAKAYKVFWEKGIYKKLPLSEEWADLKTLLEK